MDIPANIEKLVRGRPYTAVDVGMSGADVLLFEDMVLKNALRSEANARTVGLMRWLDGKLPVPRVIAFESDGRCDWLLMSRVTGKMACDRYYMERPGELITLLAEAIDMLWSVDISGCPVKRDLDTVLAEARLRVENGLTDTENAQPDTYGPGGFSGPEQLLEWLYANKPDADPVFSHGDCCLPNIFLEDGRVSGFIDLGRAGVCDRWNDLALCLRSLRSNAGGRYGGPVYKDIDPDALFDALGIAPDEEKIRYYILLDELF